METENTTINNTIESINKLARIIKSSRCLYIYIFIKIKPLNYFLIDGSYFFISFDTLFLFSFDKFFFYLLFMLYQSLQQSVEPWVTRDILVNVFKYASQTCQP